MNKSKIENRKSKILPAPWVVVAGGFHGRGGMDKANAALAACLLAPASVSARQETRYTVILVGNRAGSQTSTVGADGAREFAFEYNDRGRGPKYRTVIRLDAAGLPVSLDTSGNFFI